VPTLEEIEFFIRGEPNEEEKMKLLESAIKLMESARN